MNEDDRKFTNLLSLIPILPKAKKLLFSILQTKEIRKNFSVQHEFNAHEGKVGRMFDTCAWKGVGWGEKGNNRCLHMEGTGEIRDTHPSTLQLPNTRKCTQVPSPQHTGHDKCTIGFHFLLRNLCMCLLIINYHT